MSEAAGVTMPAGAVAVVALNEVLIHGWDLAAATAHDYRPDPTAAERCLELAIHLEQNAPDIRNGMYGPKVDVPADARFSTGCSARRAAALADRKPDRTVIRD